MRTTSQQLARSKVKGQNTCTVKSSATWPPEHGTSPQNMSKPVSCDVCGLKFASEVKLVDHKFSWKHHTRVAARSVNNESSTAITVRASANIQGTSTTNITQPRPNPSLLNSPYHVPPRKSLFAFPPGPPKGPPPTPPKGHPPAPPKGHPPGPPKGHPPGPPKGPLSKVSWNSPHGSDIPQTSISNDPATKSRPTAAKHHSTSSDQEALLQEPVIKAIFSSSSVQLDYMKHNRLKQQNYKDKLFAKHTPLLSCPPPSCPPHRLHPPPPPHHLHPPPPPPYPPGPSHLPFPCPPHFHHPSHDPPHHHVQSTAEEKLHPHVKPPLNNSESLMSSSTKSAAFKRKSSSPRRHIPRSVTNDPSRSNPQVSAILQSPTEAASSSKTNAYEKQSSSTASGKASNTSNDSEPTPSLPSAPNRVQSPLVASVKAANVSDDKHIPVDIGVSGIEQPLPIASAKGVSSLHASSKDATVPLVTNRPQSSKDALTKVTSGEPTNTNKKTHLPIVPKVSDRAKRGKPVTLASKMSSLVSEKESSRHPVTQSWSRKRPRARETIVDQTPRLVPPQKPHRRRYPTGEEIVIDSRPMQLPANCNFLPLDVETEEQGQSSQASVQVEESLGQQVNHTTTQTTTTFFGDHLYKPVSDVDSGLTVAAGNPAKCFLSEGVSGTTNTTDAEVDKGAAIFPNLEAPELSQPSSVKEEPKSPSANERSPGEVPFTKSDDTSSILTSQESTESFYTAPAYTPTKTQAPVVSNKQHSIEFESTVMQPHITNLPSLHVDCNKKADNQSHGEPTGPVSTLPPSEAMEVSFNEPERLASGSLVPTAMKSNLSTEDSTSCFSPSLTSPTEHTTLNIMPIVPCLVATASPVTECPQSSTHGSLVPVSDTSTTALQVELTLALLVCQPPLSTLASASTESRDQVPTDHGSEREQQAACKPGTTAISTISNISFPISSSVCYTEVTGTSETISHSTVGIWNHPSTQSAHQGSEATESTINTSEQRVFEVAVSTSMETVGTQSSSDDQKVTFSDNHLVGSPPISVSATGKLGVYSPTHPAWPDSPQDISRSETLGTCDIADFVCRPPTDDSNLDHPKSPLVCTYKTCTQPVYHENSKLCKEHYETAKAITSKLGIPEHPASSGPASCVPACSCTGCSNPQYDHSSKLCQQHFEMGCKIKSMLAIPPENSSQLDNPHPSKQGSSHNEVGGLDSEVPVDSVIFGTDSEEGIVSQGAVPTLHRTQSYNTASGKAAMIVAATHAERGVLSSADKEQEGVGETQSQGGQGHWDGADPEVGLPPPKRPKLDAKGRKEAFGSESQKVAPCSPPSGFAVEITSLNTKEQLLQKNIVDTQSQISKMNGPMEEQHTEIECLTKEELQLQKQYQKLITEVQDVLNQKQALLMKFQGDNAFGSGLDSRGTDPRSEFVSLNEKEHKLQQDFLDVLGQLQEKGEKIVEKRNEVEDLRKEEEQLQNSLTVLKAQYQEVLMQKQTLFCSPPPMASPVLQGQVFHPVGTPLAPITTVVNLASVSTSSSFQHSLPLSCKSEAVTPVSVAKFEALMSEGGERGKQEASTNLQGGSLDSKRLTVKTDTDAKHDDRPKEVAVKFEPHKSSVLSMKVFGNRLYTCSADKTIRAYDTQTGRIVCKYQKHQKTVTCLELYTQPDGPTYLLSGSTDKILCMHNAESGKLEIQFKCGVRIMYLCLYKNILFAGLSSGSVLFIDLKKRECLGKQSCHYDKRDQNIFISCLAVTDTLLFTAAFDNQVICWDVRETLEQGVFKGPLKMVHRLERFSNTVLCMKIHGELLYCGCGDSNLLVYNTTTWQKVHKIQCHKGAISGLCIMGKVLITASFDKLIRCFDLERLELLQVYSGKSSMVFTLCAANGVIYTGLKDGTIQATALDLTVFYPCKWEECGVRFGNFSHLEEHMKEHVPSSPDDNSSVCKWRNCFKTIHPSGMLEHLSTHTSQLLVQSSE